MGKTASVMSACILLHNDNNHMITVSYQDALSAQMTLLQNNMLGIDIFFYPKACQQGFQERVREFCNQMIKRYTVCLLSLIRKH